MVLYVLKICMYVYTDNTVRHKLSAYKSRGAAAKVCLRCLYFKLLWNQVAEDTKRVILKP